MRYTRQTALLTFALPVLLAGQNTWAEPPAGTSAEKAAPADLAPKKCDHMEAKEARLDTLKSELKLNAGQEAAWNEWSAQIEGDRKGWEERHKNAGGWEGLTAPERMEKMLAFSKEHVAHLEARLAATKGFYATLSPEQRAVFDKSFDFGHKGGFGRHGGHPPLGGKP